LVHEYVVFAVVASGITQLTRSAVPVVPQLAALPLAVVCLHEPPAHWLFEEASHAVYVPLTVLLVGMPTVQAAGGAETSVVAAPSWQSKPSRFARVVLPLHV
jgi:hypothetical protein